MLYVTTRNDRDTYTAQRVLRDNRGADGGLFVPFRDSVFSEEEIAGLGEKSFHKSIADVMNRLFNTNLTPWDVEFAVGRRTVRLGRLPQKIIVGECWHNPQGSFDAMVSAMNDILRGGVPGIDGGWGRVAAGIAVLFGIFGELSRAGITKKDQKVDISVVSGKFDLVMSAWYARAWGLPIGNIICCCNENGNLWNLFHHGQLRTDAVSVHTLTPDADVSLPDGLERLIYACGGAESVKEYLNVCRRGGLYCPSDLLLSRLAEGLEVSVVSGHRMEGTISGIYGSSGYVLSPYAALCVAGLLDYRAQNGESRHGLVLSEKSPKLDEKTVEKVLGLSERELEARL